MDIKEHFSSIRDSIKKGNLNTAIDKLQFLSNMSLELDNLILQSSLNEIIILGARFSFLKEENRTSTITFEQGSIERNKITKSILELISKIENEIKKHEGIRNELNLSVGEYIRKFGINKSLLGKFRRKVKQKKSKCLWVDDEPGNDKIEINLLAALDIQCEIARDPYEAYQILKKNKINIIVLNSLTRLKENKNEGIEFSAYLSEQKDYKDIPIIIHSISIQKRLDDKEKIEFSLNIKNNFSQRDSLIIKDLIEEIIINL